MKNECRVCGTCRFNRWEKKQGKQSKRWQDNIRFFCNNENSDAYTCDTIYDEGCELWEEKGR